jgi:hypothetical protein
MKLKIGEATIKVVSDGLKYVYVVTRDRKLLRYSGVDLSLCESMSIPTEDQWLGYVFHDWILYLLYFDPTGVTCFTYDTNRYFKADNLIKRELLMKNNLIGVDIIQEKNITTCPTNVSNMVYDKVSLLC